ATAPSRRSTGAGWRIRCVGSTPFSGPAAHTCNAFATPAGAWLRPAERLAAVGRHSSRFVRIVPDWSGLVQLSPDWSGVGEIGPDWSRLVQIGPIRPAGAR